MNLRSSLIDLALNIIIPYGIYQIAKQYFGASEILALTLSSVYPLFDIVREFAKDKTLNFISVIVLLGTITGIIGALLGGSAKLILIRESFFTLLLGVGCMISIFLKRPLLFYFAREYNAGKDPEKRRQFSLILQKERPRMLFNKLTVIWGIVFILEFLLKVCMVNIFTTSQMLVYGPISSYAITSVTIAWTIWYSNRFRKQAGK